MRLGDGSVDYVVKPFSPTELAARIKSALRRRVTAEPSEPYVLGDLAIDYARHRVTLAGRPVKLTPMESGMLAELSANAGELLERVWGERRVGYRMPKGEVARAGYSRHSQAAGATGNRFNLQGQRE